MRMTGDLQNTQKFLCLQKIELATNEFYQYAYVFWHTLMNFVDAKIIKMFELQMRE